MPCMDGGTDERQDALDKYARMLCDTLNLIELNDAGILVALSSETKSWWRKHKQEDARRKKAEEAEQRLIARGEAARKKLTKEELQAIKQGY